MMKLSLLNVGEILERKRQPGFVFISEKCEKPEGLMILKNCEKFHKLIFY